jgi:hypothetical protein
MNKPMIYYNMYFSRNSVFQCKTYISSYTNEPWRHCLFKFIQCEELFNIICFRRKLFLVTQMVVQTSLFHIVLLIITCQISCTQRFFFHYIIQPNTFLKQCENIVNILCVNIDSLSNLSMKQVTLFCLSC